MLLKNSILFFILGWINMGIIAQNYNWSSSGLPFNTNQVINCEYSTLESNLYVTGAFLDQDTILLTNDWYHLLIYNGNTWESDTNFNDWPRRIATFEDKILITGFFSEHHGIQSKIYQPFGEAIFPNIVTVPELSSMRLKVTNNTLFAIGGFEEINGTIVNGLAKWNGNSWEAVPPFDTFEEPIALADIEYYNGEYYISGNFTDPEIGPQKLAVIRNGILEQVGIGFQGSGSVGALTVFQNELIITGRFFKNAGNPGNMIMKWNGDELLTIGGDLKDNFNSYEYNAQVTNVKIINNKLYICGVFSYAGDIYSQGNVIWDGEKFCSLGGNSIGNVTCFAQMGDTIVIGNIEQNDDVILNKLAFYTGFSNECSTVGLDEYYVNANEMNMIIYPNPSSKTLILEFLFLQNDITIELFDNTGKLVLTKHFERIDKGQKVVLDISTLLSGIYYLNIPNMDNYENKIIKH